MHLSPDSQKKNAKGCYANVLLKSSVASCHDTVYI